MAIGELLWFVVGIDLDLGNKISPLIRARGTVYSHLFLFLRGSWSLLWAVFPVPMSPHHIIGMNCSWCCRRWKIITSLQNRFKSRRQDSLLYVDQSAVQIINVVRRYRQRTRRVLLQRAIESLAVVASYHPDYLLLARLEFKLHKCPYSCLTQP